MFRRAILALWIVLVAWPLVIRGQAKTPPLLIQRLGSGSVEITGPWQFHLGDNPSWSSLSLDDSAWEPMHASSSWGSQSHPDYTGFAWYRRHLNFEASDVTGSHIALLMPPVDDAYQIFWNGALVGTYGAMPPNPQWYYTSLFRTFPISLSGSGVLAIRVWKSLPLFVDPGTLGGFNGTGIPMLGDADTISAQLAAYNSGSMRQSLYEYTLLVLYGFVTLFSILLWIRNRKDELFLWLAIFTATPILLAFLQGTLPVAIPIAYGWGRALNQPIYALNHVSLWFLLLWLLRLNDRRRLVRWTEGLAICTIAAGILDGALAFFWGHAGIGMQWMDAVLTVVIFLVEVFPFVIIGIGLQHRLEASRWWVAISALVSQMIDTVADMSAAGQRFTHWTLFQLVNTPLFSIHGVAFTLANLATIVLFVSILYAVYRYSAEQQARQNELEREMQSAREIQRVLIPDALPSLEGFAVTSAYRPALEVGGDFFQIIREKQGSTIVALGDVSGKGLKAAMRVSLIVGVLRSLSDSNCGPVEMLERLNRCLCERRQSGFVTALILRFHPSGAVTLANAGHLPPFLNQRELTIEGSLPLGVLSSATYDEVSIVLSPGDQLSLYTDGLVEARAANGELYGFDRLNALFSSRPTAQKATEAAVAFGQEDDITVLTLTRLAAGEESSTSLNAPFLEPGMAEV